VEEIEQTTLHPRGFANHPTHSRNWFISQLAYHLELHGVWLLSSTDRPVEVLRFEASDGQYIQISFMVTEDISELVSESLHYRCGARDGQSVSCS
jgi:hypothetical protein